MAMALAQKSRVGEKIERRGSPYVNMQARKIRNLRVRKGQVRRLSARTIHTLMEGQARRIRSGQVEAGPW